VPPAQVSRALPAKLNEIIGKLLEKDRDLRYQSAAEVRADLKRLRRDTSSGRVSAAEPAATRDTGKARKPKVSKTIDSLAVLPFENASGDPANDYLSDGITETIINSLSRLPKVRVVPRGVVFRYKGKGVDAFTAASELGVRAVVSGRVLQHKDTLIVKAELVDVVRQNQLWGDSYNRKMTDLLEVQEEIAREIAGRLEERLGGERPSGATPTSAQPATANPEAYRLFLKASHQARTWSEEGLRNGLDLYQQAIAIDPSHAPSYAGLALALIMMAFYGFMPSRDAYVRARAVARQALQLDPTNAEAHAALSAIAVYADHNAALAIREGQEAVRLKPDVPVALQTLGTALMFSRRFDEALAAMRKAVELDPLTTLFQGQLAWMLHCMGRDDEAWQLVQSTLDLYPNDYYNLRMLMYTANTPERFQVAIEAGKRMATLTKSRVLGLGMSGVVYARAGERERALEFAQQLEKDAASHPAVGFYLALIRCTLGEDEIAIDWLERVERGGAGVLMIVAVEPTFSRLWPHPRFLALVRKLGLAQS